MGWRSRRCRGSNCLLLTIEKTFDVLQLVHRKVDDGLHYQIEAFEVFRVPVAAHALPRRPTLDVADDDFDFSLGEKYRMFRFIVGESRFV